MSKNGSNGHTDTPTLKQGLEQWENGVVEAIHSKNVDGTALMREMRATGWKGKAILLGDIKPGSPLQRAAERTGDKVLERNIADGPLIAAIAASVDLLERGRV